MKKTDLEKAKGKKLSGGGFVPGGRGGAAGAVGKREQREQDKQRLLQKRAKSK